MSFRIHPAGVPFAIGFAVATALLLWLTPWLGVPAIVVTLWCIWFFRDPERVTPALPGIVYSGADGRVVGIELDLEPVRCERLADTLRRLPIGGYAIR